MMRVSPAGPSGCPAWADGANHAIVIVSASRAVRARRVMGLLVELRQVAGEQSTVVRTRPTTRARSGRVDPAGREPLRAREADLERSPEWKRDVVDAEVIDQPSSSRELFEARSCHLETE